MPWNLMFLQAERCFSVKAEDCRRANGLVEITIHAVRRNSHASDYYKNNM